MNQEVDHELAAALTLLLEQPEREGARAAETRRVYLEQAQELAKTFPQAVTTEGQPRHTRWMHPLQQIFKPQRKEQSPMFGVLGTILLVISLVIGGGGITIAAAQNSLPDQALYPVKTWSEESRAGLTTNAQTRLELALAYTQRRAEEMQEMLQAGQTPPEAVQQRMQAEIDLAVRLASGQPDDKAAQSFDQIRQRLRLEEQALGQLDAPANPKAAALLTHTRTMLRDRLQLCDEGVQDPAAIRRQIRDRDHQPGGRSTQTMPAWKPSATGPGNPWTTGTLTPGSGYGPGPGDGNGGTNGSGGNNPWTTGTPTPGSGYGPGAGAGTGGNNPWTTGTPTPGSGYGPGPRPTDTGNRSEPGCGACGGSGSGSGGNPDSGSGSGMGGSGSGSGGGNGGRH